VYKNVFANTPLQPVSIRDVAYDLLRRAIIANKLAPQERLLEEHLARELHVSRTPLREALKVLESEGFVQRLPSGGYQVAPLAPQELDNLYSIRLVLEGLAARKAAEHATPELYDAMEQWNEQMRSYWQKQRIDEALQAGRSFHAEMYRASRNDNLAGMLLRLGDQIARYRYFSIIYRVPEAFEDHNAIAQAIRERDAERAEALSKAHVEVEHRLVLAKMRERVGQSEAADENPAP
jgi:DNA-binding GntR family transcriptional regulator